MTNKQTNTDRPPRGRLDAQPLFAAQLRAGRAALRWSQTELGEKTGVTQRAIYRAENGATQPRQLTRQRIEKAFGDAGVEFKRAKAGGFTMLVRSVNGARPRARPKRSLRRQGAR